MRLLEVEMRSTRSRMIIAALAWSVVAFADASFIASGFGKGRLQQFHHHQELRLSLADLFFPKTTTAPATTKNADNQRRQALFNLLAQVPSNESTPKELTNQLLEAVARLEKDCPTPETDVLPRLAGNWELIWTGEKFIAADCWMLLILFNFTMQ